MVVVVVREEGDACAGTYVREGTSMLNALQRQPHIPSHPHTNMDGGTGEDEQQTGRGTTALQ